MIYREIFKLGEIFENLNRKIFKDNLLIKMEPPNQFASKIFDPIFDSKNINYDIFNSFSFVYVEDEGITSHTFFQANTVD